jgi:hypothetical protein
MRIVVSDISCLIDLRKAALLDSLLSLPYEFLIPNTLFEEELRKFSPAQKKALVRGGLKVVDLPGERVLRAQEIIRELPQLSVHCGFAFALAESRSGCILLSADDALRKFADRHAMDLHGILWVLDQLHKHRLASVAAILTALRILSEEVTVGLPRRELAAYIKKYEGLA